MASVDPSVQPGEDHEDPQTVGARVPPDPLQEREAEPVATAARQVGAHAATVAGRSL